MLNKQIASMSNKLEQRSKKTCNFLVSCANQKLKHEQKNILIHAKYQQYTAESFP